MAFYLTSNAGALHNTITLDQNYQNCIYKSITIPSPSLDSSNDKKSLTYGHAYPIVPCESLLPLSEMRGIQVIFWLIEEVLAYLKQSQKEDNR